MKYIQQRFSRKIVRLLLDELHRLPEDERSRRYTERTDDSRALDAALDEFAMAESKEQVLEHLKSSEEE